MFGIDGGEFIVLVVVAAVVLGPERLPQYAQQLGRMVRELRRMAMGASAQVRSELGPEFDDIDWKRFDPRQYDPRRIVRDALADTWDPDDPLGLGEKPVSRGGPGIMRDLGLDLDQVKEDVLGSGSRTGRPAGAPDERRDPGGGREAPADPGPDRPTPVTPFDSDAT